MNLTNFYSVIFRLFITFSEQLFSEYISLKTYCLFFEKESFLNKIVP